MSKETPENIQISSAQQFKQRREARDQGDIFTLSSGLSVLLKRPNITRMIAKGLIPPNLVQRFMDLESAGISKTVKAEDIEAVLQLQRAIAPEALISPKVVDTPDYDNNEINIEDLDDSDLEEIWTYVNGGLEAVESFRQERTANSLSRPDSDEVSA
jgi:hypothetical protein